MKYFHLLLTLLIPEFSLAVWFPKPCVEIRCQARYAGYQPTVIPEGKCIKQINKVVHINIPKMKVGSCRSTRCREVDKTRTACSCREVTNCWWASWGAWTGSITQGTCGKQHRRRAEKDRARYVERYGSCSGVKGQCNGSYNSEDRTMCNCRKASSCPVAPWSSWTPAVGNGQCKDQTRHQDKKPSYTYVMKEQKKGEVACFGIDPDCRPPRITDTRTFCKCPTKECTERSWTSWNIDTWTGSCPNEKRTKTYDFKIKYIEAYKSCNGVGKDCPPTKNEYRKKVIKCPAIKLSPNSIHLDKACNGVDSSCTSVCRIDCKKGYKLIGQNHVTCHGSGKWTGKLGYCKDSEPPTITCPKLPIPTVNNKPGTNYSIISFPNATATDNSGFPVTITTSHPSPLKVFVHHPVEVTYTATDAVGNTNKCKRKFIVKDHEAPVVTYCPKKHRIIKTGLFPHQVFWPMPRFTDNVEADNELVFIPSVVNGTKFYQGKHSVDIKARDKSSNTENCTMTFELQMLKCPVDAPPKHGSATCNIKNNGKVEAFICTAACQKGSWFLEGANIAKVYNLYVCSMDGAWQGASVFNFDNLVHSHMVPINRGDPMWPDCSVGKSPNSVALDMQIFSGKCSDQASMEKLKRDFVATLKKDFIWGAAFCSQQQQCDVENAVVYCSKKTKRSTNSKDQMVIKFSISVRKTLNQGVLDKDNLKQLNTLTQALELQKTAIVQKVTSTAVKVLKDNSVKVNSQKPSISCKQGSELQSVNGTIKCLQCPSGTFYQSETKKCTVCQPGFFQNREGALSCENCPQGETTKGTLSSDFHRCKAICHPGTYSKNGLAPCTQCPSGTYQPSLESQDCIKCPSSNGKRQGLTDVKDCNFDGIKYEIRSEGCGDPGKTSGCGISTIKVEGKDYSKQRRGINFVAIDGSRGTIVGSASFDWHYYRNECTNALKWTNSLNDGTIVLGAYQDEATLAFTSDCQKALEAIGGKRPFQRQYRSSYVIVGYKGKTKKSWVTQQMSSYGRGPTQVTGRISFV
ncbi:sushi, von Willebrand factor type A, EGF and pentraxin domain-containing protein 1-like [Clytia hemisphaerica]|uniref:Uncharacterized protein n=1 Tax=Clytia hemisphaerica TaxID=252671 RepID=A0A7M5VFI1_9CNID